MSDTINKQMFKPGQFWNYHTKEDIEPIEILSVTKSILHFKYCNQNMHECLFWSQIDNNRFTLNLDYKLQKTIEKMKKAANLYIHS